MEVRDKAFHLLLRKTGNLGPPLLHAMRLGASHQDVAIVLLGAFSRWINHLEDDQLGLPETQKYLKVGLPEAAKSGRCTHALPLKGAP
jgi:hypothetical protein